MPTETRIYTVTNTTTGAESLVRATHRAQALSHVAKATFAIEVATQDKLVALVSAGAKVADATAEVVQTPLPLEE